MKSIILIAFAAIYSITTANAQIKNATTKSVKVNGNCGMCQTTIEKAATKKNISKASWNEETKMATITYDSKKTTLNAVLKNIAQAGYDNEQFTAPDNVYANLHGCCQYDRDDKVKTTGITEMEMKHNDATKNTSDSIPAKKQSPNQLPTVFDNYFLLKNALVKSDGASASASSKALLEALDAVQMETLSAGEHTAWMKAVDAIKINAKGISANTAVAGQRKLFMALSSNMYDLLKSTKSDAPVYYQFCPMANGGKGANWLSKENAVKNPYYGSMMLTCGKTVETIQ